MVLKICWMINGDLMSSEVSTEEALKILNSKSEFDNKISADKVIDYLIMANDALNEIEFVPASGSKLYEVADDYEGLAESYFKDAKYYIKRGDLVTAFGALNYAHGFLDAGVRLGVFRIENDEIFAFYNRE